MRPLLFAEILAATCVVTLAGDPPAGPAPQMIEISQKTAIPGEIVTVSGLGLSTKNVDEIYLTDHKFDMRVKVIEQKDTAVKFRIPPFAKPGRMQLLFLTKGSDPKLLEQPLYLLIEDPETEIATAKPPPDPVEQDSSKMDEARPDVARPDVARPDVAKPESLKDLSKADQAKPEPVKEQAKPETKLDLVKLDQSKQDSRQPQ